MATLEAMQQLVEEQSRALAAAQLEIQESQAVGHRLQLRSNQLERDAAALRCAQELPEKRWSAAAAPTVNVGRSTYKHLCNASM